MDTFTGPKTRATKKVHRERERGGRWSRVGNRREHVAGLFPREETDTPEREE